MAVQGRNGLPVVPAEAATATSTSTKVLDMEENKFEDSHFPGPGLFSSGLAGVPSIDLDYNCVVFETEMEAEVRLLLSPDLSSFLTDKNSSICLPHVTGRS